MNGSGNQISMRGDKVTQLQTLLAQDPELAKAMTYEKDGQAVVVDGLAGARTRGAVETYAAENNLNLNTMSVDDLIAHAQNNAALKVSVSADVSDTEVSQTAPASDGPPVWAEKIEAGSVDGTAPVAGAEYYTAAATQEKITSNFNTESSPEPKTPEPVPGQRWDAGMTPLERTLAANNTP
jgi:peptidoglycan hydrolase-like protein with peptidoglycan-binding domain